MTISSSLANALSGLTVSGRRAEVVSNNIANAQTEGYGRRELATSSGWGGVQSHGVVRNIDRGIINDRRLAESQLGADQRRADMLLRLETLIGIPGDGNTIAGRLADLESALVSASSDPASDQRLAAVNTAMKTVVDTMHRTSDGVQILRQDADAAIATDVEMLNSSLRQLEQINADISRASASGMDPSSLLDARHHIVDTIGAIVPVRELDRGRGQLGLMTVSGMILIDGNASQFGFSSTATIVPEMTLASGGLSGLTFNGQPVDADDGFGRLAGGSLAAAFTQRDNTFVDVQNELDKIAYDMVARFSDSSVDPTIMSLGLLTDNGGVALPANIIGLASRLSVNSTVDPSQGGLLSRWRDGVGAVVPGPIGNASQIEGWRTALAAFGGQSVVEKVAILSEAVSTQRLTAQTDLSFTAARWDSLHSAELATGVDTDAELQNLILIEQAYAANAKVIQTVNAMIQRLMEI